MNTIASHKPAILSFPLVAIDVEALYVKYAPMILRRCRALLRDEELAQDALQDVFVQVLRHRHRLHGRYPSSLLYRMATNISLNMLRSRKRRRDISRDGMIDNLPGHQKLDEQTVDKVFLQQLFKSEPESTRWMAQLRHQEGLTLEETAMRVGLSVSGVRKRLRGLRRRGLVLLSA